MAHPEEEPDLPGKLQRRPSHFRNKAAETTTRVARVSSDRTNQQSDISHVVRNPRARQEQLSEVINPAPPLPDPVLHRAIPPPAPLPSDHSRPETAVPGWTDERRRRKRIEDIVGTVGLAIMVAAMLAAMWMRMTSP